ncbi:MAG: hypothetical protein BMS9Abin32_327 [Gammaproteobacteria bacterium]|nr:MAG: hypothetical protein BMS9Abin32_327 [Gammaproteobacteria bacterium]
MNMNRMANVLTWLTASTVGVYFALRMKSAAMVDGLYTPVGNDSFYHARRILDAAVGPRGFYQFDNMIHVPEGSWLTWPWAYDYLLAQLLRMALWISPGAEPMALLSYLPLLLLVVNTGLLVLIAREMQLQAGLALLALLAFAAFPLNQFAYGVGVLDHHSAEQLFALLSLWLGLRYLRRADQVRRAVVLGAVLGIAPAFHTGLFILQIPLLLAVFILWLRGVSLPRAGIARLAAAIFVSTLLVLLPSGPFLDGQFAYSTLSWFHLYAAFSTAAVLLFLSRWRCTPRHLAYLALSATLLTAPLTLMIVNATRYLAGDFVVLQEIAEVKSPLSLLFEPNGAFIMSSNYSWLILAAPIVALLYGWRALREAEPDSLFFAVSAALGLLLLLTQVRLHVFGSWALFLGGACLLQRYGRRHALPATMLAGGAALLLLFAYYPAVRYQLFKVYPPGLTNEYSTTRSLYPVLAAACKSEPGIALAYHDDGHYVRYHTDCSVIANNFLLTAQHGEKIRELQRLLRMTPEQLLAAAPEVRYVFVRLENVMQAGEQGFEPAPIEAVRAANERLFLDLTMRKDLPPEYRMLREIRFGDGRDYAYARVFKIVR